jgi:hypothetical protein
MRAWLAVAGGLLAVAVGAPTSAPGAPIVPDSPTDLWVPLSYPTLLPDFSDDQRTGLAEADIVGNAIDPSFYTLYDDAGTPSLTDGTIAFRVRLGADRNPPEFSHFFGVGLDADLDGALDLFLAVDNSGNPDQLGIFDPGTGLNTSPSTTTIDSTPLVSYAPDASNYDFSPVDATIDPTATSFDIDNDGYNDYFLTALIPFQDVVDQLAARGITGFDEDSSVRYVMGTSTQPNALNQDLGGPDGGTRSSTSWEALGAMSNVYTPSGIPVPEPGSFGLVALGLAFLARSRSPRGRRTAPAASPVSACCGVPGSRGGPTRRAAPPGRRTRPGSH